jgi:hypothetical protein
MDNLTIMIRLVELYKDIIAHDGFGEIHIGVRILKRGQKEVIIYSGKQYRYVVDFDPGRTPDDLDKFSACLEKHLASSQGDAASHGHKHVSGGKKPPELEGR